MQLDADALERIVPDQVRPGDVTGEESLRLSVERYEFAARHVCGGRVLDIACGVGYGTRILADRAGGKLDALGVDLSEEAIAYAREHFGNDQVRFIACDAMRFDDPEGFDAIVSIETIEHLPDPVRFADRTVSLLRPGGLVVGSVPVTPSVDANPYHLHDFTQRSFRQLFARHGLMEVDAFRQDQPFKLRAVLTRSEARMKQIRRNLPGYYLSHPGSLLRRAHSILRYGFKNKYLTIVWRAPA